MSRSYHAAMLFVVGPRPPVHRKLLAKRFYEEGGRRLCLSIFNSSSVRLRQRSAPERVRNRSHFVFVFGGITPTQMNTMHPKTLRTHTKLYNCVFMGEQAQDAGGPYRESWSMYAQELQVTFPFALCLNSCLQ